MYMLPTRIFAYNNSIPPLATSPRSAKNLASPSSPTSTLPRPELLVIAPSLPDLDVRAPLPFQDDIACA
ncbi:hypothetical protein PaG_04106 [Moesziomyces aphidis]|uniref:Uncharacterized protein n=1 Tax=Moesziomyces aphidis TaxID=84754 RepID=W3VLJ1_MOEAP|nr:hypothetical protein PaG_04106 [Moesziomyces aphidis]